MRIDHKGEFSNGPQKQVDVNIRHYWDTHSRMPFFLDRSSRAMIKAMTKSPMISQASHAKIIAACLPCTRSWAFVSNMVSL